jgi:predicted TIM-barrel fold metal-dependent hydrolase
MQRIFDTHVHVWDLERFSLPWLDAVPSLKHSVTPGDYAGQAAKAGSWRIERAVYVEVDLAPAQREEEADYISGLCAGGETLFAGASVSLDLAVPPETGRLERYRDSPWIKGVRHVLHVDSSPGGTCLEPRFMRNVGLLGEYGLLFEACLRCEELEDLVSLARACPGTNIVLNHMGIVKPEYIDPNRTEPEVVRYREQWLRDIDALAALPNVCCKISGLNPEGPWTPETFQPALAFCFDAFGGERVLFGGNFPVCGLSLSLGDWVDALLLLTCGRSQTFRDKLFFGNAQRVYGL